MCSYIGGGEGCVAGEQESWPELQLFQSQDGGYCDGSEEAHLQAQVNHACGAGKTVLHSKITSR